MHLKFDTARKRFFAFFLLGWILLIVSDRAGELRNYQGAFVAMYSLAIACLILLTGYSGQLSLGQGALMAVGGYSAALTATKLSWHPVIALIMSVLVAGLVGLLIGFAVARLSGPYLSGTTLALAISLPALANTFPALGAEEGIIFNVGSAPAKFGEEFSQYKWFFWISALAALISIWLISNLLSSKFGRSWKAIRDNQTAAALSGLNPGKMKVIAFAISSAFSGLAGALLVMLISAVSPSAFPLSLSFLILTGAVVTGVYSLRGVVFGALVLVAIPEIADSVVTSLGGSERLTSTLPGFLVSMLLILAVLFSPNGPGDILKTRSSSKKSNR